MSHQGPIEGPCRICGDFGRLSFEHVPPRAAFNKYPVLAVQGDLILKHGLDVPRNLGVKSQRGAGGYTLCVRCNNRMGRWYGSHYVEWFRQAIGVLNRSGGRPQSSQFVQIRPLPVIKQVIAMFFSANSDRFREAQPYLEKFILNREQNGLPPDIRVFAYYTIGSTTRSIGVSGAISFDSGTVRIMSEISFRPFGYVLSFGANPPDSRLTDISHFAHYAYDESVDLTIRLPMLDAHLPLPGDYRTRDEIDSDERANAAFEDDH